MSKVITPVLAGLLNEVVSAMKPNGKQRKIKRKTKRKRNTRIPVNPQIRPTSAVVAINGSAPKVVTEFYTPSNRIDGSHCGVRGCMWVTDIISNTAGVPVFASTTNPWNQNTFYTDGGLSFGPIDPTALRSPLSNIAGTFSQFRCKSTRAHFRAICPTSTTGQVVLGLCADVPASAWALPTVKLLEGSIATAPWNSFDIYGSLDHDWKYSQDTSITSRDDNRFSDSGVIAISGSGCPANVALGALYFTFDFEFRGVSPASALVQNQIDLQNYVCPSTPGTTPIFRRT